MPAQSSRSIGFLMLVGSSLTLCGIICNNKAMLSPGFLRYDPSKSNYGLLVTIVVKQHTAYSPKYSLSFMSHHAERISLSVVRGVNRAIRSHLATLSARLARA